MLSTLATAALAVVAIVQQTETTVAVTRGARLEADNFEGQVAIGTWDRDAVRVTASHAPGDHVDVDFEEGVVSVSASGEMGPSGAVDLRLTVPRWMPIEVSGVSTDVTVEGAGADLSVETVDGSVTASGGAGFVSLESVQGEVSLRNANGRIELSSINAPVRLSASEGDVSAETVNGEILLQGVRAGNVDATTVNGRIVYDGPIRRGGAYRLSTHNGGIRVTVPADANVRVQVSTFNGEVTADFPIPDVTGAGHGQDIDFVLGSGGAHLELESFQGLIELRRPAAAEER